MVDVPGTVTTMRVVATMGMAIADSNDAGNQPDLLPSNAKVAVHPVDNLGKPLAGPLVAGGKLIPIGSIICQMRNGVLYAPDNGRAPGNTENSTDDLWLINPMSTALSQVGWHWQADFTPLTGDGWTAFPVSFQKPTDDDGVTCDLAKAILDPFNAGTPATPIWLPFLGVGGNGATTIPSNIPAAPAGTLALDYGQDPWFTYYQNGA